jgi:cyclopropane-fatty-acyl-phospholipid synthase
MQFEQQMERYFQREYKRWRGNRTLPEAYGVSSFEGDIASAGTRAESIEHYNRELRLYQSFLDSEYMTYTMAYYGATDYLPRVNDGYSLGEAQVNKFNLVIQRAGIEDGQSVLELGCGFGGFSRYLLRHFPNVRITGINPSEVQTAYLRDVMYGQEGYSTSRFRLVEKFFDELDDKELANASFDRVISIGVLEAVTNLDKLFELISRVLKPGGRTFHHFIVSADTIPQFLKAEKTMMSDYFPGGHIWPYAEPMRHERHLHPVSSWFVNGLNYWKTLDIWHKRFWNSVDVLYPSYLTAEEVADWNRYFSLCKTMFSPYDGKCYGVGHYLYEK